jgi:hypothetical protein
MVVATMLVVRVGSTMTMLEEAAAEAAEEAGNGPGGGCVVYFILVLFFLTITAATTECRGNVAVSSREAHSGRFVLVAFVDVLSSPSPPSYFFLTPYS